MSFPGGQSEYVSTADPPGGLNGSGLPSALTDPRRRREARRGYCSSPSESRPEQPHLRFLLGEKRLPVLNCNCQVWGVLSWRGRWSIKISQSVGGPRGGRASWSEVESGCTSPCSRVHDFRVGRPSCTPVNTRIKMAHCWRQCPSVARECASGLVSVFRFDRVLNSSHDVSVLVKPVVIIVTRKPSYRDSFSRTGW